MTVVGDGQAECPFAYEDFQAFWRANVSAGPVQAAIRQVIEGKLAEVVRSALRAYQKPDGSLLFENTFQHVVSTPR